MNKRDAARLTRMISRVVRTFNAYKTEHDRLMDWCREYYGYEPGDIDADYILDSLGACGAADDISPDRFDQIMRDAQ